MSVEAREVWRIATKIDLAQRPDPEGRRRVSARTGEGLEELVAALGGAASASLSTGEAPGLTRARHRDALGAVAGELEAALGQWNELPEELLAERLRTAATELGRVTGRIGVEEVLGRVFSSFCIGK